jgi:Uncharacterised nucleotidyltransferase
MCDLTPPSNITLRRDVEFVHQTTGLRIELHWRLFLNPYAMSEASILLFAYLCMHGAIHWWDRLKWLADINALLTVASDKKAERLIRAAEAKGAGRVIGQALLLCQGLFQTPLPASLMATLTKGLIVRWLAATALKALNTGEGERERRELRFGTTRGSLSTVLLSSSWRYQL